MTKYQELVEEVKNMDQLCKALKAKVDNEFIKELAIYLLLLLSRHIAQNTHHILHHI